MERNRQYNLRSVKQGSIQVPVEIQMCNDRKFLESLLNPVDSVDRESDPNSSTSEISDLDCSALLNMSDNSDKNEVNSGPNSVDVGVAGSQQAGTSSSDDCNAQILINQEILSQLHQISQRLDKLEDGSKCKKSSDPTKIKNKTHTKHMASPKVKRNKQSLVKDLQKVPNLAELRQNAQIQTQVQQRLKELEQLVTPGIDSKIKSQRGGVDVFIKNRVRWPHEHVLSGSTKERVSYDQLTVTQWVSGFCRTIREEKNETIRSHMLDYIISLMDDANDFSWGAAKASHAVLNREKSKILVRQTK